MKIYFVLFIMIFSVILVSGCKAQNKIPRLNDHELDINSLLSSKEISVNVDSLLNNDFDPINSKLQTSNEQAGLEKLLVGNWIGNIRTRINGKDKKPIEDSQVHFSPNFYFNEIINGDTLSGEYLIEIDSSSNLVLIYDEPQYPPYPKDMLGKMTKEELEQIAYHTRYLNVFEVDEQNLIFYNVIPIVDYSNPQAITHSRLILEQYVKNKPTDNKR